MRMFRDVPLTRRKPETIRYATGRRAVGALLVASSEKGIVSIMVRAAQPQLVRNLGARFRAVANSCSRSWFAFAIPCHRVLHPGATPGRRREGRQYDWVDYEARLAAKRRR